MKVLLVGSDASISGAGLSMIALSKELNKIGINTVLVVRSGNTQKILAKEGIPHYCVQAYAWTEGIRICGIKKYLNRIGKAILNIPAFFQMLRIIDKEEVDIVHINASTTYIGALAAFYKRKKVVWHFRELLEEDLGERFWNKNLSYKILSNSACCIAISKCVFEKHKPMLGDTAFRTIYNGIDIDKFLNLNHTILQNDKVIFTIAGRISEKKGQLEVLMAMCNILKLRDDVELWIVGDGKEAEKEKIVRFIKQKNITDSKIRFWGYVTNMPEIWAQTDVAIIASKFEAFGRVTVEAMCSGCLVLGANTGGTIELVDDEVTGIIYEQGRVISLEKKINKILKDKETMRAIALRGRDFASKTFTAQRNAENIKFVYEEVLNNRSL